MHAIYHIGNCITTVSLEPRDNFLYDTSSFTVSHVQARLRIRKKRISVSSSVHRSIICLSVRSYRNVLGNLRNDVIINYVASHVNSSQ